MTHKKIFSKVSFMLMKLFAFLITVLTALHFFNSQRNLRTLVNINHLLRPMYVVQKVWNDLHKNFQQGQSDAHEIICVFCNRTDCAALFINFTA